MPDYKARLILISADIKMRSLITRTFQSNVSIEVITNAYSVAQLSSLCIKGRKNIVILDTAIAQGVDVYLKSLYEKFSVLTLVLSGTTFKSTFTYAQSMARPVMTSPALEKSFADEVARKVERYLREVPQLRVRDMASAVDERQKIIAIAASTGGTEALLNVLQKFPADCPPIVIVQHMPSGFTKLYADRVDKICAIEVREAKDGDHLKHGLALIAPGDFHMKLVKSGGKLCVNCFFSDKMHGVRPAADILFSSVAQIMGPNAIGAILTGMGADGARGLYEMKLKGSYNIGQDKASCVVYGMPKVAFDMGALDKQLPLDMIGDHLMSLV